MPESFEKKLPKIGKKPIDPDLEETGFLDDPSEDTEEESLDVIDGSQLVPFEPEEETRDSLDDGEKPPIVLGVDEQLGVPAEKRTTWDDEEEMTQFGEDDAVYIGKSFNAELQANEKLDALDKKLITRFVVTMGLYIDKAMDEVFHTDSFAGGETLANIATEVRRSGRGEKVAIFLNRHIDDLANDFAEVVDLEMKNIEASSGMRMNPKQKTYEVALVFDKIRDQIETDVLNNYLTDEDRRFMTNLEFSLDKTLRRAEDKLAQSFRE